MNMVGSWPEAPEASWCGRGRNRRKGTSRCQSLLLKQIGIVVYHILLDISFERTVILRSEGIVLFLWLRTRNNSLPFEYWYESIFLGNQFLERAFCYPHAVPTTLGKQRQLPHGSGALDPGSPQGVGVSNFWPMRMGKVAGTCWSFIEKNPIKIIKC